MNSVYNCTGHRLMIPNVVNSDGIYLFDDNGRRYMDLESGVWCTSLGHKNARINALIKKQIDAVTHAGYCYSNNIVEKSAASVLNITGYDDGKCVFLCSGSESIELARQIAKRLTDKKVSMTLSDSYLGSYSSVTDRSKNWFLFNWEKCGRCHDRDNCRIDCEELKNIPDTISDFIFEPGSSSGFVRFPPKSLITNIVNTVRGNGGIIIANEVTTGIGRTGKWFGYHHYQIEPDMVAIGKGIGNGYPVSITAINRSTVDRLEKIKFKYMQSHQNDPLGAAIVNEVIETIQEEDLVSRAAIKGAIFLENLQALKDGVQITEVRGRGLMFAVDICNQKSGERIYRALLDKGYIVCDRGALFRIDPPLIIDENEFLQFTDDFREIIQAQSSSR